MNRRHLLAALVGAAVAAPVQAQVVSPRKRKLIQGEKQLAQLLEEFVKPVDPAVQPPVVKPTALDIAEMVSIVAERAVANMLWTP